MKPKFQFRHHYIDTELQGRSYGQTSAADVDGDGLPEFIMGQRGGNIYWYDYQGPDKWHRYLLGNERWFGILCGYFTLG